MKISGRFLLALAAILSLVHLQGALAQEKAKEAPKPAAKPQAPAAAPSQEEMMKVWMEVATPGEGHKKLEPLVGTFSAKTKAWMAPGTPPQETEGTSESKWVLGNRFIEQHVEGTMMNQPFSGVGYTGYDNYKKKYVGTWMDSMGTMIMSSTGTMDRTGKTLTSWSTIDDPVLKKPCKIKSVLTIVDGDHHNFEMWGPDPSGKVFKMLEIAYSRKK